MILLACSFSLLVIVSGMFLLAKTKKDGLSKMFMYVSYFVIFCGFFSLFAGGAACIAKRCMMHCQTECKEDRDCDHHGRADGYCHKGMMMTGDCDEMHEGEGMEMKKSCCKEMHNEKSECMHGTMMPKKDSIVTKK